MLCIKCKQTYYGSSNLMHYTTYENLILFLLKILQVATFKSYLFDQKFISEMVSKYISPDQPPWHMMVVPSSDKFYVLIRLHHLYLSEERLSLADLLMLQPDMQIWYGSFTTQPLLGFSCMLWSLYCAG